jgi:superfamily II DNA or RNA helicase
MSRPPNSDAIRRLIADTKARLTELEVERAEARMRLEHLEASLVAEATQYSAPRPEVRSKSPSRDQKVAIFRALFAGRPDVFPKLRTNAKSDKHGYAPACANEWVRGICEKPKVRCGECPSQAFLSVTDQVLVDHLQGRHVVGVYPLFGDDTCRLLAVDFDKGSWREDVVAYAQTARRFGLAPAVERSRSGDGAHVWFFFSAAVSARNARKMASYLLTETMAHRPEIPLSSYDRLFPNQDRMPRGGFGNLIALPLQYAARKDDNTVFVDDEWKPFSDQWAYLGGLPRIDSARVDELAREASAGGMVLGIRRASEDGEEDRPPRLPLQSGGCLYVLTSGPVPSEVHVVFAQKLFIEKAALPPALVNQINRLAAFQNPQFYAKQAMRLSTALTPRIISCAEDLPGQIGLPRGCLSALEEVLQAHGVEPVIDDQRIEGAALTLRFHGKLTEMQERAARALLAHEAGVFVAPPGTGKTVVGAHLIASRGCNALVIVHRTQLVDQWRAQLGLFLGVDPRDIGEIGGGKRTATGGVDVATIRSLVRPGKVDEIVASYGHVLVDECHHVPAVSFERVMGEVRARYITGLTATPKRRDGHHPILSMQIGPIRYSVSAKSQAALRPFEHHLIVRETQFRVHPQSGSPTIQELYGQIAASEERNEMIIDDVISALEDGRSPIVLTERRDHLEYLAERLGRVARNVVVLKGGVRAKRRAEIAEELSSIPDTEERLLVATGRFIGEGFDDARLDTLFLTMPVSWKGTLVQYAGRLHRVHQGKTDVRIFDYVDSGVPMLARMFEKRQRGYRAMGYQLEDHPEDSEAVRDLVIEYDEEASRSLDLDSF